jgi:hypothetical protein
MGLQLPAEGLLGVVEAPPQVRVVAAAMRQASTKTVA